MNLNVFIRLRFINRESGQYLGFHRCDLNELLSCLNTKVCIKNLEA